MKRLALGAVALALLSFTLFASAALAHERRQVGPYTFVVGFLVEPAYTGQVNGVDLRVTQTATNAPVEGLQETLQVEVTTGGQSRTFALRTRFGQPGAYAADFAPTRTGTYVFRFFGRVGDQQVDERFESGPGRFNEPQPIAAIRFPPSDPDADLRAALDQTRLLALAALVAAIALPIGVRYWPRR